MKRAWIWVVLLLSLGVNVGVLATLGVARIRSGSHAERPMNAPPPAFSRLADRLRLEGEVRQRFLEIQRDLFESTRQQREELRLLRNELHRELMAESPDAERFERLLGQLGDSCAAMDRALVESVLASREVLSPAQQKRYLFVLGQMRGATHRGWRRGIPPPGPSPER